MELITCIVHPCQMTPCSNGSGCVKLAAFSGLRERSYQMIACCCRTPNGRIVNVEQFSYTSRLRSADDARSNDINGTRF